MKNRIFTLPLFVNAQCQEFEIFNGRGKCCTVSQMIRIFIVLALIGNAALASADGFSSLTETSAIDLKKHPAEVPGPLIQSHVSAGETRRYDILIYYSESPELRNWAENELRPALEKWYPLILEALPSKDFKPPERVVVTIKAQGSGIAYTSGTQITVISAWIKAQMSNPKSEAVGSVIHELAHVAQQYGRGQGNSPVPGWLTEGIADYIRWWKFEPPENRRPVNPVHGDGTPASYTDGYQTTAAFLEFAAGKYDHEIVVKLNAAGRERAYSPDLWNRYTGKPLDALWAEFAQTLK